MTITAVSLASFGVMEGLQGAVAKSQQAYQRALLSTKQALADPAQLTSDGLLITVMSLSHYEGMMNMSDIQDLLPKFPSKPGQSHIHARSWSHFAGAISLLKLRQELDLSEEQVSLNRTVRRGLVSALNVDPSTPLSTCRSKPIYSAKSLFQTG